MLGHGAGGGVGAADLVLAASVANELGLSVVLVEQPYRVAGRRSAAPAPQLDAAWTAVLADLRARELAGLPIVTGGRSSGARVACRTAAATGAAGVLCLAFPLQPARRRASPQPAPVTPARAGGGRGPGADRPGPPPTSSACRPAPPGATVAVVEGDHALRKDRPAIAAAIRSWLPAVV